MEPGRWEMENENLAKNSEKKLFFVAFNVFNVFKNKPFSNFNCIFNLIFYFSRFFTNNYLL